MSRFLLSRYDFQVVMVTMIAYIVMMRKVVAFLLGGWFLIGFLSWGFFSLGCGQPVNIFLFTWCYINTTLLSFALALKFVRNMRKRPVRILQHVNG